MNFPKKHSDMNNNFYIEPTANVYTQLTYNKNREEEYCGVNYLDKRVSSIRLIDFYRKYNDLKNKLKELDKALEEYKAEVLDNIKLEDDKIFIKQVHYKTAFKNLVEAHEELVNIEVCNYNQYNSQLFDEYA